MDDERDEIPSELRAEVLRLVEETYPPPGGHPEAERWTAYLRGQLPAEEVPPIEEHLVRCRDCFDLLQAIDAFAETAGNEDATEPGAEVAATALSRLVLQQAREARAAPAPRPWGWRSSLPPTFSSYLASAAVFALAVLGVVAWRQHEALARLRAPQANAQIVDLMSGERAAPGATRYAARTGPLTLVLHPADERRSYRLVVRDAASGRNRLDLTGLRPDAELALTVHLPLGLAPGTYRLELRPEAEPASNEGVEELELRVEGVSNGS
jgi:hypothetical protein